MPTKTTKKTTTTKKTVAKKVAPAKAKRTVKVSAPVMEQMHDCHCGKNCHCGKDCHCGENCKCHGCKFCKFTKKLFIAIILFALGFAAAKVCCCGNCKRGMRPQFAENGCMVTETVKCPKMREMLPMMDIDQDGCITHDEYRTFKHQMRHQKQNASVVDEVVETSIDAE